MRTRDHIFRDLKILDVTDRAICNTKDNLGTEYLETPSFETYLICKIELCTYQPVTNKNGKFWKADL